MKPWLFITSLLLILSTLDPSTVAGKIQDKKASIQSVENTVASQIFKDNNGNENIVLYLTHRGAEHPGLVVRLSQLKPDLALAEIFDAPPNLDYVPLQFEENIIILDPSLKPAIKVKALDGWWVRDGIPNYNLDIEVFGPIYAMWGAERYINEIKLEEPLAQVQIRADATGYPHWDIRQLLPDLYGRNIYRTNYAESKCAGLPPIDPGLVPAWPYIAEEGSYEQPRGKLRPPIVVDWDRSKITYFSEIVTVRNQSCSYSLYSLNNLFSGIVNQADFESPFALYDLSGTGNGYPNLILRTERYPKHDPSFVGIDPDGHVVRANPLEFETIRYSWRNEPGDGQWDYKVEVLGFHPYTFQTPIASGTLLIDSPSYESLPKWVVERNWPVVTFVDVEGNYYSSSEGIYDWSPREVGLGYVLGSKDQVEASAFRTIVPGRRGEYRYTRNLQPKLYFSPIDNRLHLLGAEGGLWGLEQGLVLRLLNLDRGDYINGWLRERFSMNDESVEGQTSGADKSTVVEEALYDLKKYLLYMGSGEVRLKRANYQPFDFEIFPPTDKASWQSFRDRIEPYTSQRRDPRNLKSWLSHYSGESLTITGGSISDVRVTTDGFRFVLELLPGFEIQGDPLLNVKGLEPNQYVITYDKNFKIERLTPPVLSTSILSKNLAQLEINSIQLMARNDGLQDVPEATINLWTTSPEGSTSLAATQAVTLLAQTTITTTLEWAPASAGEWTLTPVIRQPDGHMIFGDPTQASVLQAQAANFGNLIPLSVHGKLLPFLIIGLISFAGIGSLVFFQAWKRSLSESEEKH